MDKRNLTVALEGSKERKYELTREGGDFLTLL
jgi:predicted transcriptional regulator